MIDVAEAVQWRGHRIVELSEAARRAHLARVIQSGKALELGERFRLQRAKEVARIKEPVESAIERVPRRRQIDRRRDRRGASQASLRAAFAKPLEERIAAERNADRRLGS